MPRLLIIPLLAAVLGLGWFWYVGGFDQLAAWAAQEQRHFQNAIARALRAARTGEAGALTALLTVCFAYGFFHAVGPGHGKVLIGGYGVGRRAPVLRLVAISVISSLGQSLTAILLVYAGVWIFHLTRQHLTGLAEEIMAPLSYGAIVLVGLWLLVRGVRHALSLRQPAADHHHHDHDHDHDCGHRHGPTLDEVERAGSLRETLALIGAIAIRPCSGAIFVLLITWQMGIALAGIAGTVAMGLGTATVTVAVALAAAGTRGGLVTALAGSPLLARAIPVAEILAGLVIASLASGLLLRALAPF